MGFGDMKISQINEGIAKWNEAWQSLEYIKVMTMENYRYCSVLIKDSDAEYLYICKSLSIRQGDFVMVPFGRFNIYVKGIITSVKTFDELSAPYPTEQTKYVISKITKEAFKDDDNLLCSISDMTNFSGKKCLELNYFINYRNYSQIVAWISENYRDFPEKAIRQFMIRALFFSVRRNYIPAMLMLYSFYKNGTVIRKNPDKAFRLLKKAAECGDHHSTIKMGYHHFDKHEYEKSFYYFNKCALKYNDCECMYKIGDLYMQGVYGKKSETLAFQSYIKALNCSFYSAEGAKHRANIQLRLGKCLLLGKGCTANPHMAIVHLRESLNDLIKREPSPQKLIEQAKFMINKAVSLIDADNIQ